MLEVLLPDGTLPINHSIGISYLVFCLLGVLAYRAVSHAAPSARNLVLALLGLAFAYALTLSLSVVIFYVVFFLWNWLAYLLWRAAPGRSKRIPELFIATVVLNLAGIKYFSALVASLIPSLDSDLPLLGILGLSYVSFKSLDFLIELRRGRVKESIKWPELFAFIVFFPTIPQGPILRFIPFMTDLRANRTRLSVVELRAGLERICVGIVKILFLAQIFWFCSPLNSAIHESLQLDPLLILASLYSLYLYIYIEFSGISDVAITVSKWLGFRIPENFDYPLLAKNPQDFWARWHMSLTQWCQDHIFFNIQMQLMLRFRGASPSLIAVIPVFVTFVIIGIWHGSSLNWLYYGLLHALAVYLVVIAKNLKLDVLIESLGGRAWNVVASNIGRFLTFNFISFSLVFALPIEMILKLFPWLA